MLIDIGFLLLMFYIASQINWDKLITDEKDLDFENNEINS